MKGCVGVLGALPNAEGVCVNTTAYFTVCAHRLNAKLEFIASIRGSHPNSRCTRSGSDPWQPCRVEDVASAEFGCTRERTCGDEGLFTVHAIVVPLETFLPTLGNGGFVITLCIAGVNLGGAIVEGSNGVWVATRAIAYLYDLGGGRKPSWDAFKPFTSMVRRLAISVMVSQFQSTSLPSNTYFSPYTWGG